MPRSARQHGFATASPGRWASKTNGGGPTRETPSSGTQEIYSKYLQNLEGSAVATNTVREGKQYLKHEKITANDLGAILKATVALANDLLKQE